MTNTFDHLIIVGRPAAGKSEFIDFMKQTPDAERAAQFHIGKFEELDDFRWLWEKFSEDDLWEEAGSPRLYSRKYSDGNYGLLPNKGALFDLMFARFNHETKKRYLSRPEFYRDGTLMLEFARGEDHGYRDAFARLSKEVLERAAILAIKVSYEESRRRNDARYQEKLAASILAHKCPDDVMERFYRTDDWDALTKEQPQGWLTCNGMNVPFVTMFNEPELKEREPLAKRYGPALDALWKLSEAKR